jgi:hypothetical protein
MRRSATAVDGVIGGILAGAVVAVWFFVLDAVTAEPLHTPRLLAGALLGHEPGLTTARLVAVYTLLHFGVFAVLGVGAVWLARATGETPRVMTGALFGIGALSAVHYGALLMLGAPVLTVLPPIHVLAANLLGGVAMMLYLHRATGEERDFGPGMLRHRPLLADGVITGTIGAIAVALWFLVLDTLSGRPFYTPAALGSALLLGAQSPADIHQTAGVVAAYTILHLLAFFLVGVTVAWSARQLERLPNLWLMALLTVIMVEALFFGVIASLAMWVLGAIGLWAVVIGNLVGVAAMGFRVWSTRPELRHLVHVPAETHA